MIREMSIFAREDNITVDGKAVKKLRFSYTPNGKKFYKVVFKGTMQPNAVGYWLVKVEENNIPKPIKGRPVYRKDGTPVIKRDGTPFIENDVIVLNELVSLEIDKEAEARREENRKKAVSAIFDSSSDGDESMPF